MAQDTAAREAILEPELPIIDPHHHLWDRRGAPPAEGPPRHGFEALLRLSPRYMLDELLADMKRGHKVFATVYMECGSFYRQDGAPELRPVGETEMVTSIAAVGGSGQYGPVSPCAGIIGHVDLTIGERAREVLEAHVAHGGGRFRGIRHSASADADPDVLGPLARRAPGLYRDETFRKGFGQLGPLGLSFDAWLLEPQLPELVDLARTFPETTIILDHVGTPLGIGAYARRRGERFDMWRGEIKALAELPNVSVKVGGLAMPFAGFDSFMSQPAASSEQLAEEWRPYVETCIETFGPTRCMFESNFPVDLGSCTYDVLWNAFKRLSAGASAEEKTALFSDTARRVYRLDI
ncbi:MAG TPA: amidohydrolase family protein [Caulobacteraceae bacterium]|jgi:predicted TIM-barrel fold metal-dependent hydrolase